MRQQYHFLKVDKDIHIWDINKILQQYSDLPIKNVKIEDIKEIDEGYWYDVGGNLPTCRSIVEHAKLILAADLNYPILLCKEGRVMDGMHRVCKALLEGKRMIDAIQLPKKIPPDYINVHPDQLPY